MIKSEKKEKEIYKLGRGKYPIFAELINYDITYFRPQGSLESFEFEELVTGRRMFGGGWTSRTLYYEEYVEKYMLLEPEELMKTLKEENPDYNALYFSYEDSIRESSLAEAGAFFRSLGEEGIKDYIKMLDEMQEKREKEEAANEDYARQLIKKRNLK